MAKGSYSTILVLAVVWRLTNQMTLPQSMALHNHWWYGIFLLRTWCDLINVETPFGLDGSRFSAQHFLLFGLYACGENIIAGFFGHHFMLDYVLNGLLLAFFSLSNYTNQLSEKCYDLCEWVFDMFENLCDRIAKLCQISIEKVFKCQMHMPTIKDLSQGQRQLYQYILLSVCIATRCVFDTYDRKVFVYQLAEPIANCLANLTSLLWMNFDNLVGNTQLWQRWLALWGTIKDQVHRQLWLRCLALWENISAKICEDYLTMPGGLEPNQYHTRYFVGLDRLRLLEYGILIQVLPDLTHMGMRCFQIFGITVFNGDHVPVPTAPSG